MKRLHWLVLLVMAGCPAKPDPYMPFSGYVISDPTTLGIVRQLCGYEPVCKVETVTDTKVRVRISSERGFERVVSFCVRGFHPSQCRVEDVEYNP